MNNAYNNCRVCPRVCGKNRQALQFGVCQVSSKIKVARAALHFWEEPCISGENGSGAVFFSGCPLHCVFCQNEAISWGHVGKEISIDRLCDIFFELQDKGANNINLVTPTQYIPSIAAVIELAKKRGFTLPFIFNSSGYESVESLKILDGLIDVYLPDFKYYDSDTAKRYSHAPDYPLVAKKAIEEMFRQTGKCQFDEAGMIVSGVIVRHLLLPLHVKESLKILNYLFDKYANDIYFSIMSQFTPMPKLVEFPEINRRVTKREYEQLIDYAIELGIENAFIQEREVAMESFIPDFNGEGV